MAQQASTNPKKNIADIYSDELDAILSEPSPVGFSPDLAPAPMSEAASSAIDKELDEILDPTPVKEAPEDIPLELKQQIDRIAKGYGGNGFSDFINEIKRGDKSFDIGNAAGFVLATTNDQEKLKALHAASKYLQDMQVKEEEMNLPAVLSSTAQVLGGIWGSVRKSWADALAGAAIGAAVGGGAGTAVAPGAGTAVAGGAGWLTGLGVGLRAGMVRNWMQQGAGDAYFQMIDAKTPEDIARKVSIPAGIVYGAIENIFKLVKFQPAVLQPFKNWLNRGLIKSTLRMSGKYIATKYVPTVAGEALFEEPAQKFVIDMAQNIAADMTEQSTGTPMEKFTKDELFQRMLTEGIQALGPAAIIAGAGGSLEVIGAKSKLREVSALEKLAGLSDKDAQEISDMVLPEGQDTQIDTYIKSLKAIAEDRMAQFAGEETAKSQAKIKQAEAEGKAKESNTSQAALEIKEEILNNPNPDLEALGKKLAEAQGMEVEDLFGEEVTRSKLAEQVNVTKEELDAIDAIEGESAADTFFRRREELIAKFKAATGKDPKQTDIRAIEKSLEKELAPTQAKARSAFIKKVRPEKTADDIANERIAKATKKKATTATTTATKPAEATTTIEEQPQRVTLSTGEKIEVQPGKASTIIAPRGNKARQLYLKDGKLMARNGTVASNGQFLWDGKPGFIAMPDQIGRKFVASKNEEIVEANKPVNKGEQIEFGGKIVSIENDSPITSTDEKTGQKKAVYLAKDADGNDVFVPVPDVLNRRLGVAESKRGSKKPEVSLDDDTNASGQPLGNVIPDKNAKTTIEEPEKTVEQLEDDILDIEDEIERRKDAGEDTKVAEQVLTALRRKVSEMIGGKQKAAPTVIPEEEMTGGELPQDTGAQEGDVGVTTTTQPQEAASPAAQVKKPEPEKPAVAAKAEQKKKKATRKVTDEDLTVGKRITNAETGVVYEVLDNYTTNEYNDRTLKLKRVSDGKEGIMRAKRIHEKPNLWLAGEVAPSEFRKKKLAASGEVEIERPVSDTIEEWSAYEDRLVARLSDPTIKDKERTKLLHFMAIAEKRKADLNRAAAKAKNKQEESPREQKIAGGSGYLMALDDAITEMATRLDAKTEGSILRGGTRVIRMSNGRRLEFTQDSKMTGVNRRIFEGGKIIGWKIGFDPDRATPNTIFHEGSVGHAAWDMLTKDEKKTLVEWMKRTKAHEVYSRQMAEHGYNIAEMSEDQINDEVAARFLSENEDTIKRMARNKTALGRIVEKVRQILELISGGRLYKGASEAIAARRGARLARDIIEGKVSRRAEMPSDTLEGADRNFFDGEGGTSRGLSTAKNMEKAGSSINDIWRQTGWYKDNVDGKWKTEIDPSDSSLKPRWNDILRQNRAGAETLGGIIDSPELFSRHPYMKRWKIELRDDMGEDVTGSFTVKALGNHVISLNRKNILSKDNLGRLSSIMHEAQHGLQVINGFSEGTSMDAAKLYAAGKIAKQYEEVMGHPPPTIIAPASEIDKAYKTKGGEAESRLVQYRMTRMTKAERMAEHPLDTRSRMLKEEKYPESELRFYRTPPPADMPTSESAIMDVLSKAYPDWTNNQLNQSAKALSNNVFSPIESTAENARARIRRAMNIAADMEEQRMQSASDRSAAMEKDIISFKARLKEEFGDDWRKSNEWKQFMRAVSKSTKMASDFYKDWAKKKDFDAGINIVPEEDTQKHINSVLKDNPEDVVTDVADRSFLGRISMAYKTVARNFARGLIQNLPSAAKMISEDFGAEVERRLTESGNAYAQIRNKANEVLHGNKFEKMAKEFRPDEPVSIRIPGTAMPVKITRGMLLSAIRLAQNVHGRQALISGGWFGLPNEGPRLASNVNLSDDGREALDAELLAWSNRMLSSDASLRKMNDIMTKIMDDEIFPELARVYKSITGKELKKEQAYIAIHRIGELNTEAEKIGSFARLLTDWKSLENRVSKSDRPILITDASRSMYNSMETAARFIGYAENLRYLRGLLGSSLEDSSGETSGGFAETIDQKLGAGTSKYLLKQIQAAEGIVDPQDWKFLRKIMQRQDVARLSGPSTMLKQVGAIFMPMISMDLNAVSRGFLAMAKGMSKEDQALLDRVQQSKWGQMVKLRLEQSLAAEELAEARHGKSLLERRVEKVAFLPMRTVDAWTVKMYFTMAKAATEYESPNLSPGSQEYVDKIARITTKLMNDFQPAGYAEYRTAMHNAGVLGLLFNRYRTSVNAINGTIYRKWLDYKRSPSAATRTKLMAAMTAPIIMQAMYFSLVDAGLETLQDMMTEATGDDDDKKRIERNRKLTRDENGFPNYAYFANKSIVNFMQQAPQGPQIANAIGPVIEYLTTKRPQMMGERSYMDSSIDPTTDFFKSLRAFNSSMAKMAATQEKGLSAKEKNEKFAKAAESAIDASMRIAQYMPVGNVLPQLNRWLGISRIAGEALRE